MSDVVEKQPLTEDYLKKMDAYWRAANYLGAAQLYLLDNPLLREPLTRDQVKKKIVGHWGKWLVLFIISFLVTGFQNIGKSIFSNCNLLCVWRIIKGMISYRLKERILNGQICIGYGKICRFGKDCICGGMRVIEK